MRNVSEKRGLSFHRPRGLALDLGDSETGWRGGVFLSEYGRLGCPFVVVDCFLNTKRGISEPSLVSESTGLRKLHHCQVISSLTLGTWKQI